MERYIQLFKEYRIIRKNLLERFEKQVKGIMEELKFYTDVMNYLEYGDIKIWDLEKIKSLKDLYYFYMESDDYIVGRFEDTEDFIEAYIKSLEEN